MPVPHLLVEHHTLFSVRACCDKISLPKRYLSREPERGGNALFETDLPGDCKAFLEQRGHPRLIPLGYNEHKCQLRENMSDPSLVLQPPVYRQALLEQRTRQSILTLAAGYQRQ